ncbi:MAG: lipid-binding SYLF domain-containing protein [Alphaproteobacteria bacterium]|nr:lipid-binding SYLF domain-containing protein [Alphaproteobacteria bacterium]
MRRFATSVFAIAVIAVTFSAISTAKAANREEAQEIVDRAIHALDDLTDRGSHTTIRTLMKDSKGVIIFPSVIKGALIFGGEGGSGVLMSNSGNNWSSPAFYHLSSFSWGLQIGGQETRIMMIVMSDKGMNMLMDGEPKVGGDLQAAAISEGVDKELSTTSGRKDIYYYAETEGGLFAGISLEGSLIKFRKKTTRNYYGEEVTPEQILINRTVSSPGANELRAALRKAAID